MGRGLGVSAGVSGSGSCVYQVQGRGHVLIRYLASGVVAFRVSGSLRLGLSGLLSNSHPPLPSPALPCLALPCPALPCPALPCPALPCPALPCPALPALPAQPCPNQGTRQAGGPAACTQGQGQGRCRGAEQGEKEGCRQAVSCSQGQCGGRAAGEVEGGRGGEGGGGTQSKKEVSRGA